MMKKLLITSLAAMSLLAFGACGGDDEDKDKDKKECTSSADCADGKICSADGKCVDGTVTAGCTSDADCATGETCNTATGECEAGTVTAGCTSDADCATGETCNAATGECEATVADPCDACTADQICKDGKECVDSDYGDVCDETFVERCDGNVAVYCSVDGIYGAECGENSKCGFVENWGVDCLIPCDGTSETVGQCEEDYEADGEFYDVNWLYTCERLTDGSGYGAYFSDDYELCNAGCAETKDACYIEPAPEGWTCDASYYGDGDCDCGCGIQDSDCADATYASCVYNDCETGHPDPAAPTTCVTVTGEGDACDSASADKDKCVDNVMLYCSSISNTYEGWACGTDSCLTDSDGTAGCYGTADACQENDPAKYECGAYGFSETSDEYVCTQMSDNNYYYMTTGTNLCESTCDETTGLCVEVPKPEGWTCLGSYYGDGGCDCGCGIQDTDCADASATSCDYDFCEEDQVVNATQNWICE